MHIVSGGCHCGNIQVELELTLAPTEYHPRACDCDFCRMHGAAYISDPNGALRIRIGDDRQIGRYRQGSGVAECLLCANCGVLIGALYEEREADGRLYATVNTRAVEARASFGSKQVVSPKALSSSDKQQRWRDIWFRNVSVTCESSARPSVRSERQEPQPHT